MIDCKKKLNTRYFVRQSQHTIYCARGPKSFSAVVARKTTAQSERHTKFVNFGMWESSDPKYPP